MVDGRRTSGGWRGRRLDTADLRPDGNGFTALRWALAASVMISHGWDLTQDQSGLDPTVAVLTMPISWLAVSLFFSLSGFLVTGSLVKRGLRDFALARALRLLPGLWVMLIVVVVGLWLIFGRTSLATYLGDPLTLRYIWRNALTLPGEYQLPGMFLDVPVPGVNGSLWTIPQEVRCYIALAVIGAAMALRSRTMLAVAFVALAIVHLSVPVDAIAALAEPRRLALSFFLGVVAYQWRDRLILSWPLALSGTLAGLGVAHAAGGVLAMVALQLGFAYLTLVAAFAAPAAVKRASARLPDYSYGIYIYAFPVQQTLIALGWATTPLANIVASLAITIPLAALSWHLVEHPALRQKPRLVRRAAIIPTAPLIDSATG